MMEWLYGPAQNITLRLDAMYLGQSDRAAGRRNYRPPTISQATYHDIVQAACERRHRRKTATATATKSKKSAPAYRHLRLSKLNGEVICSQWQLIAACEVYVPRWYSR